MIDDLSALALDAALAAGELLLANADRVLEVGSKSTPTDVVTEMDRAAEELLVTRLLAARPDDGVLGEETGERRGSSGVRWVLDPLDGTVNYLYRIPQWAVCVAAEVDGVVEVAVVVDPSKQTTWHAVRGAGAFRDGKLVQVGQPTELAQALVGTGFGYAAERRAAQARVVAALLPQVRDIRRLGAAALDLCAVASGSLDAHVERGLAPWDLAAAGLIAQEAGAVVAGLRGAPAGPELVIAAPPSLFAALHEALLPLDADRD